MRAAPAFGQALNSCSTVGAKLEEVKPTLPPCFNALRHSPRLLQASTLPNKLDVTVATTASFLKNFSECSVIRQD